LTIKDAISVDLRRSYYSRKTPDRD